MNRWQPPVARYPEIPGSTLHCVHCNAQRPVLYEMELNYRSFSACYRCLIHNPQAMQQWVWALRDLEQRAQEQVEALQREIQALKDTRVGESAEGCPHCGVRS